MRVFFATAFENVVSACEKLESYFEDIGDLESLTAASRELGSKEEDFSETETLVIGYLKDS
jgi:hypothetical protein